jgi:MscS family membrane protein
MRRKSSPLVARLIVGILVVLGGRGVEARDQQEASTLASPDRAISSGLSFPAHRVRSATEIARWNDRTTPRRMLETFFFAIVCYDLAPELIVNAIDCLDLGQIGKDVSERDAALMAHELAAIVSKLDIALYGVPDRPDVDGGHWVLVERGTARIALQRQPDGRWRFDSSTATQIPSLRAESYRGQRELQQARMKMVEGLTDPETAMRSFFSAVVRRDFTAAAACLDLRDVPLKLRSARGPELARKLAFVMQRCAFAFPQEIPSDPDGWRYIWHSNHRGRIMLDRVRQADGRDAWLFSRNTLHNLDALVSGFKEAEPDPRYRFVGVVIDAESLAEGEKNHVPPPQEVPPQLRSPRIALRTFLEGMDELEFDDHRTRMVLSCMDMREVPVVDLASVGLRVAAKLEVILRHLNIDLLCVPDTWDGEPQSFGKETECQVTLARQADGAWRFDQETIARVAEMFDRLPAAEKAKNNRSSMFSSARQTMRSLRKGIARGDQELAASSLDLTDIPFSARSRLGPVLAQKLKFVIDRIGDFHLQEIPDETEGPRFIYYRGPLGRISLESVVDGPRKGEWLFTRETVAQVEPLFLGLLKQGSLRPHAPADAVTFWSLPLLVRCKLPAWLERDVLGLTLFQWLGGLTILLAAVGISSLTHGILDVFIVRALRRWQFNLSDEFLCAKLLPLTCQLSVLVVGLLLPLLDFPAALVSATFPVAKSVWVGLLAWTAIRLIDLAMAIYTNSEHLQPRRNLSDMIVPTSARVLKLSVLVVALCVEVFLIGSGEWVTRLLAGLGLVGLAASLAAQDTLKNFFGTLLLIGEHPFKIGDSIVVNNMEGTVESVGFRSTWVRTPEDSLLTIPNSIIAGASIDNRGVRQYRRYRTLVAVATDTPIDRLVALRDALRAYAGEQPLIRADRVAIHVHALTNAGVELLVNVYFKVATIGEELQARDELTREILEQARRFDVEIGSTAQKFTLAHGPESGNPAHSPRRMPPPHHSGVDHANGESSRVRRDA